MGARRKKRPSARVEHTRQAGLRPIAQNIEQAILCLSVPQENCEGVKRYALDFAFALSSR